jgi:hypothetical protein
MLWIESNMNSSRNAPPRLVHIHTDLRLDKSNFNSDNDGLSALNCIRMWFGRKLL